MKKALILAEGVYFSCKQIYLDIEDIKSIEKLPEYENEAALSIIRTNQKSYDSSDHELNILSAMSIAADLATKENRLVVVSAKTLKEVPLLTGKEDHDLIK